MTAKPPKGSKEYGAKIIEASQSERPFIIFPVTAGNGSVIFVLFKVTIHPPGEKTMKKFAFVLAALAAIAFTLPVTSANAGMRHHHHHHHHHMMHR
jgi:hypothetical protein